MAFSNIYIVRNHFVPFNSFRSIFHFFTSLTCMYLHVPTHIYLHIFISVCLEITPYTALYNVIWTISSDCVYCKTFSLNKQLREKNQNNENKNKLNPPRTEVESSLKQIASVSPFSMHVICCHKVEKNKGINFYYPHICEFVCFFVCVLKWGGHAFFVSFIYGVVRCIYTTYTRVDDVVKDHVVDLYFSVQRKKKKL